MTDSISLRKIQDRFGDSLVEVHSTLGEDTAIVAASILVELAGFLKDDPDLDYSVLMDLTAVDHHPGKPRFEVVYHFLSMRHKYRLRIKIPVEFSQACVDTLSHLWPNANWYEREVYDMFGIEFRDHPDLRRILLYPEFEGHSLRKDYPIDKRQPLVGPKD